MRSLLPLLLLTAASSLAAQTPVRDTARGQGFEPGNAPQAVAVRAERAPVIDGREDDATWRSAPATSDFQEFSPTEGKAPRFRTEFKAAFDDRHLYVFVRAFDPHPDSILTALTRRDVRGRSDQLKVMVDAYHDRRSGFEFAVNPLGVKRDYSMYNDGAEDVAWDGVWDVATRIDSAGWTAEFRIPFSQLRYANRPTHSFGFAIWRDIERYAERTSWPLYRPSQPGLSSQLGVLTGVTDIMPFRRREIVPYTVAKNASVRRAITTPGDPAWGRQQSMTVGADVKYGITPNLTVDATVNPDFGQVEADPAVLNLTAFEQFFQERRPFFLEGTGLYSFTQNSSPVNRSSEGLFYSRRIGRTPQLLGLYGDASSSNTTPIWGAAKLTGRLGTGLNFGVLEAITGDVRGTRDRTTEPRTNYTVVRAQQDLRHGETSVGFIATGVNRALDEWSENFLRRDAYAFGTDLRHRWGRNRYEMNAKLTGSIVRGTAASILSTQTNAVHFFQRPDDRVALDPTRTSLVGDAQELNIAKFGGNMVRWLTSYERQSPGYEVNDLGFLGRANRQAWKNWVGLNWQQPTRFYRRMNGNFNYQSYWTADGMRMDHSLNTNWSANLANNSWIFGNVTAFALPGSFCDNCARGGPAVRRSPGFSYNIGWNGDERRWWVPNVSYFARYADRSGSEWRTQLSSVAAGIAVLPMPQLQASIGANLVRNRDDAQWFGNFRDASGATHYTFARLEQQTLTVTTRLDYAITPTLSFQFYGQPFVSRGEYENVRELSATPRAEAYGDRFVPFTPPANAALGFNALQLRSNSVLRWEFRPGSALFAVWQHGRDGFDPRFRDQSWGSSYDDLLALHPANTFLLKMSYWLNP